MSLLLRNPGASEANAGWRRALARRRGFTLAVAGMLVVAMGAAAAAVSLALGTFEAARWWRDDARAVLVWPEHPFSRGQLDVLRRESEAFEAIGSILRQPTVGTAPDGTATASVAGVALSVELFDALRHRPLIGPGLVAENGEPGTEPVAVLGYGLVAGIGGWSLGAFLATRLPALFPVDAPVVPLPPTHPAVLAGVAALTALAWVMIAGIPVVHFLSSTRRAQAPRVRRGRATQWLVSAQAAFCDGPARDRVAAHPFGRDPRTHTPGLRPGRCRVGACFTLRYGRCVAASGCDCRAARARPHHPPQWWERSGQCSPMSRRTRRPAMRGPWCARFRMRRGSHAYSLHCSVCSPSWPHVSVQWACTALWPDGSRDGASRSARAWPWAPLPFSFRRASSRRDCCSRPRRGCRHRSRRRRRAARAGPALRHLAARSVRLRDAGRRSRNHSRAGCRCTRAQSGSGSARPGVARLTRSAGRP